MARQPRPERVAILVRLEADLHEALRGSAEHEMRSVNAQVEVFVREGLARRGRKARPPQDRGSSDARDGDDDGR